uniref:WAP domain-containing protein n=1 Tax=Parastrongyloides trichosuri TaxID=131310 RepID=A0A0N5A5V0_PARTI
MRDWGMLEVYLMGVLVAIFVAGSGLAGSGDVPPPDLGSLVGRRSQPPGGGRQQPDLHTLRGAGACTPAQQPGPYLGAADYRGHPVHTGQRAADHDGQHPGAGQPRHHHVRRHHPDAARHAADRGRGVHRQYSGTYLQAGGHRPAAVFGAAPPAAVGTPAHRDVSLHRIHRPLVDAGYLRHRDPGGGGEFRPDCQCRSQPGGRRLCQCGDSDNACCSNFRSPTDLG